LAFDLFFICEAPQFSAEGGCPAIPPTPTTRLEAARMGPPILIWRRAQGKLRGIDVYPPYSRFAEMWTNAVHKSGRELWTNAVHKCALELWPNVGHKSKQELWPNVGHTSRLRSSFIVFHVRADGALSPASGRRTGSSRPCDTSRRCHNFCTRSTVRFTGMPYRLVQTELCGLSTTPSPRGRASSRGQPPRRPASSS
jgi:hypothetical protein